MSAAENPRRFADWHATDKRWYAVIVLAAVAVRLLTWQGIGYLDSLNYAEASLGILDHGLGTGLGFTR